ncbi:unnamed protein product [Gadus morhua 'NCC']
MHESFPLFREDVITLTSDEELEEVLLGSPNRSDPDDNVDIKAILNSFRQDNLETGSTFTVIARRRYVLRSACAALSKTYFGWHKEPSVEFVSEMAADYGGPRREFFRRWTSQIWTLGFSQLRVMTRAKVDQIKTCSTEEDLATLKQVCGDWIAGCGVPTVYTANLQDLPRVLNRVVAHFIFHRVASMIQQFTAGMNSCGRFWDLVKSYWRQFVPVFTHTGEKLTRHKLLSLFIKARSEEGSNRWEMEESTLYLFEDWLLAIEEGVVDFKFEELLIFLTGADCLPPLGFPDRCSINFYDQEPARLHLQPVMNSEVMGVSLEVLDDDILEAFGYLVWDEDPDGGGPPRWPAARAPPLAGQDGAQEVPGVYPGAPWWGGVNWREAQSGALRLRPLVGGG